MSSEAISARDAISRGELPATPARSMRARFFSSESWVFVQIGSLLAAVVAAFAVVSAVLAH